MKYNVDVDLGMSGFNFHVEAPNDEKAAEYAMTELFCRGIKDDEIEEIRITVF